MGVDWRVWKLRKMCFNNGCDKCQFHCSQMKDDINWEDWPIDDFRTPDKNSHYSEVVLSK